MIDLRSKIGFPIGDNVLKLDGKQIRVQRAPEPSDVIWENCGVLTSTKFKNRILTILGTILILAASFVFIFGI